MNETNRYTTATAGLMIFGALGILAGCGGPSAGEVIDKTAPVVCEKVKECMDEAVFALAHPDGVEGCIEKVRNGSVDRDAISKCDMDEVDACLSEFKAAACPGDNQLPQMPCDC